MLTETVPASIGACMQRLRLARGISLRQMGRVLHVHHSTYAAWEKQDAHVPINALIVIAHYLEISLLDLIPSTVLHPSDVTTWSMNGGAPRPPP